MKNNRIENDTLGPYKVPFKAAYGSQTQRSYEALRITNRPFSHEIIKNIIRFKSVLAKVNKKYKKININKANAIIWSCNEILNNFSKYKANFITDEIQGGAGTSVHMNVNEVIANIASKKLGKKYGEYFVSPNDDVNFGQSTNDVFPTSAKITFVHLIDDLILEIQNAQKELVVISKKFENIIRVGKTHLQDAVPMKYSSLFTSWSESLSRDIKRLEECKNNLLIINIGGTAIGTGISQSKKIVNELFSESSKEFKLKFKKPRSFIDANRNVDSFTQLSDALKNFSINLSKNCNDIRLLSSSSASGFNELILKEIQPGSSIMPGKINPIIYESINQIAFAIIGRNASISFAAEAGQMELNVFEPIIFTSLIESLTWAKRSCSLLIKSGIKGLKPNKKGIENNVSNSNYIATLFIKKYGYSAVSKIIYNCQKNNLSFKNELQKKFNISNKEFDKITKIDLFFPLDGNDE